jgi:hypothetical protein
MLWLHDKKSSAEGRKAKKDHAVKVMRELNRNIIIVGLRPSTFKFVFLGIWFLYSDMPVSTEHILESTSTPTQEFSIPNIKPTRRITHSSNHQSGAIESPCQLGQHDQQTKESGLGPNSRSHPNAQGNVKPFQFVKSFAFTPPCHRARHATQNTTRSCRACIHKFISISHKCTQAIQTALR